MGAPRGVCPVSAWKRLNHEPRPAKNREYSPSPGQQAKPLSRRQRLPQHERQPVRSTLPSPTISPRELTAARQRKQHAYTLRNVQLAPLGNSAGASFRRHTKKKKKKSSRVHDPPQLLHPVEQQIPLLYARLVLGVFGVRPVCLHDTPNLSTRHNHSRTKAAEPVSLCVDRAWQVRRRPLKALARGRLQSLVAQPKGSRHSRECRHRHIGSTLDPPSCTV